MLRGLSHTHSGDTSTYYLLCVVLKSSACYLAEEPASVQFDVHDVINLHAARYIDDKCPLLQRRSTSLSDVHKTTLEAIMMRGCGEDRAAAAGRAFFCLSRRLFYLAREISIPLECNLLSHGYDSSRVYTHACSGVKVVLHERIVATQCDIVRRRCSITHCKSQAQ